MAALNAFRTPSYLLASAILAVIAGAYVLSRRDVQKPPASFDQSCESESQRKSLNGDTPTSFNFRNESRGPVQVFWLDYQGLRKLYHTLAPGQSYFQQTYLTHPWVITDTQNNCLMVFQADRLSDEFTLH